MLRQRLILTKCFWCHTFYYPRRKIIGNTFHQCRNSFDQYFDAGYIQNKAGQYNLTNFKMIISIGEINYSSQSEQHVYYFIKIQLVF